MRVGVKGGMGRWDRTMIDTRGRFAQADSDATFCILVVARHAPIPYINVQSIDVGSFLSCIWTVVERPLNHCVCMSNDKLRSHASLPHLRT